MTKQTEFQEGRGYTREDWDEVSDNPTWTPEMVARARRGPSSFPPAIARMIEAKAEEIRRRGPQRAPTKQQLTLRVDRDVLEAYKATGPGWQRRMQEALRKGMPAA